MQLFFLGENVTKENVDNTQTYTKLCDKADIILKKCLLEAAEDEVYNLTEPGISCGNLAKKVLSSEESTDMKKLAIAIFEMIYPVFVKKKLKKRKEREKSYRTFYNITINDSLFKIWEEFLNSQSVINNKYSRMLWGFILDRFLFNLVKTVNEISRESPEKLSEEVLKLTPMEEATIRYVSGYIPYSLKKKYSKLKDIHTKEAILAVLNFWSDELDGSHETFLQYTKEWVDKVNRGGLFKVSDDFYIFIRHVEMHARSILNVNLMKRYAGENIHLLLMKKIENSSIIDICWNNITSRLDNDI